MSSSARSASSEGFPMKEAVSVWAPLKRPVFRMLWIAATVCSLGYWMQDVACAWLMTSLAPSPIMVSLTQTATYLPYFLLSLPAGALADLADRRIILIITQTWIVSTVVALALLTLFGVMTPWLLLILILLGGIGLSVNAPAWNALPPELVAREELESALALGGAGYNLCRGLGAAFGGILVAWLGGGWVFLLNACCILCMIGTLIAWRRHVTTNDLPPEHVIGAIKAGVRYVKHSAPLRAVLVRTALFVACSSAVWGLLPLLARKELGLDSSEYGLILSAFGVGTFVGAAFLPRIRQSISLDWAAAGGSLLFASAMESLAVLHGFLPACVALFFAGIAWIVIGSSLNAGLLLASPAWVRARTTAVYLLTFNSCLAFGSLLWGTVASAIGMRASITMGAAGMVLGLVAMARYSLVTAEQVDLRSTGPQVSLDYAVEPHPDRGPVLISVEYHIDKEKAQGFIEAMGALEIQRRRNGASRWHLFQELGRPGIYVESFFVETWGEYLRHRERATMDDIQAEERAYAFHKGDTPPKISHLVAERRRS